VHSRAHLNTQSKLAESASMLASTIELWMQNESTLEPARQASAVVEGVAVVCSVEQRELALAAPQPLARERAYLCGSELSQSGTGNPVEQRELARAALQPLARERVFLRGSASCCTVAISEAEYNMQQQQPLRAWLARQARHDLHSQRASFGFSTL
jgi:hypothetical protein